jgi:hypothetical protein
VLPQSLLGKAVLYALGQWRKLIVFLEHGEVPLDNNRCENAIRPFVVGRKGWLFSDTVKGAIASANLFSIVETAKANGVEPHAYLSGCSSDCRRPGASRTSKHCCHGTCSSRQERESGEPDLHRATRHRNPQGALDEPGRARADR